MINDEPKKDLRILVLARADAAFRPERDGVGKLVIYPVIIDLGKFNPLRRNDPKRIIHSITTEWISWWQSFYLSYEDSEWFFSNIIAASIPTEYQDTSLDNLEALRVDRNDSSKKDSYPYMISHVTRLPENLTDASFVHGHILPELVSVDFFITLGQLLKTPVRVFDTQLWVKAEDMWDKNPSQSGYELWRRYDYDRGIDDPCYYATDRDEEWVYATFWPTEVKTKILKNDPEDERVVIGEETTYGEETSTHAMAYYSFDIQIEG